VKVVAQQEGTLRLMVEADLERVLAWRNHISVRQWMLTQHEIALQEHRAWFERSVKDDRHHLLIFESPEPIGFVHFSALNARVADWGFYLAPDAARGSGGRLAVSALNYAFEHLNLHKVAGQALDYNERSIALHNKLGFKSEGILREHHFDGEKYHSLHCFGLLQNEWQASRLKLKK